MPNPQFDIVVIGGGIHGAGVAQAAAAAGYSVLVLEQTGLASGTSSRSSKLIHGGLRYLESRQFSLVRECLHERRLLLKLAPELVALKPFYLPVYPQTRRRPWQLRLGLSLYAILNGLDASGRFTTVSRSEWDGLDGIETRGLQRVFRYYDAQTDDVLLTQAVMNSALSLGAQLALPATFVRAERRDQSVIVDYRSGTTEEQCETRLLINAAGPWANQVLAQVSPAVEPLPMELIQGSHIILDSPLYEGIYYVEAPSDGRALFVMPWQGRTMIGTTETPYRGDPAACAPLEEEISYLWQTLGHYFPRFRLPLEPDRIYASFAGLRVLPATGSSPFSRSRDTLFHPDEARDPRIITIYGGKLTAYRAVAERLVRQLQGLLPSRKAVADTRRLPLTPP